MSGLSSVVVVGASVAGLRAAETLRDEGFDGALTLIGAEEHRPYDRPPLSKDLLIGISEPADVALRVRGDLDAEWILGDAAARLDLRRRVVVTESGREAAFDGVVLATGSAPRRLPALDVEREGVVELRTLEDALALRECLRERPRVVLVGSGFIGVEVASSARTLGADVDVVSLDPPLIVAGTLFSDVCRGMLVDHGVRLHLGRSVAEVVGGEHVEAVALDDGTRLPADLILVAVGARPVTGWLDGSGLRLEDGVVCDASLAAVGAEGVVVAGDIARWPNPLFGGLSMRVEHWTNAAEQGAAAARTLVHGASPETAFASVPSFWSDHFGGRLQSVGLPGLADRVEVVGGAVEERRFVAAAYKGEQLVGATTYGMVRALMPYRAALARREPAMTEA